MSLTLAAIRTGTDPIGKLPEGAFHHWLEEQLICPKCDATYNLVCDYNAWVGRRFEEESRKSIMLLKKAIFMAHGSGHRVSHFETNGVVVSSHVAAPQPTPKPDLKTFPPPGRKPTIH